MTDTARRILIVANRTASTPALLDRVRARAHEGATFILLIPPETGDAVDWSSADACRLIGSAAGRAIETEDPGEDAAGTVHELVVADRCDEVILSTQPEHHARWHHHDLPHRLQNLGIPVTLIPPEPSGWGPVAGFPPEWVPGAVNPAGTAGLGNY
jgi:hypothetical protein